MIHWYYLTAAIEYKFWKGGSTGSRKKSNEIEKQTLFAGFKFNFFDSLLKLASGIIFYLLNLSANLLFHTYEHC